MEPLLLRARPAPTADELLAALAGAIGKVDVALRQEPRDELLVRALDRRIAELRLALAARDYPASA
jgi:hypothetical protein